jgi:hypothetical protein
MRPILRGRPPAIASRLKSHLAAAEGVGEPGIELRRDLRTQHELAAVGPGAPILPKRLADRWQHISRRQIPRLAEKTRGFGGCARTEAPVRAEAGVTRMRGPDARVAENLAQICGVRWLRVEAGSGFYTEPWKWVVRHGTARADGEGHMADVTDGGDLWVAFDEQREDVRPQCGHKRDVTDLPAHRQASRNIANRRNPVGTCQGIVRERLSEVAGVLVARWKIQVALLRGPGVRDQGVEGQREQSPFGQPDIPQCSPAILEGVLVLVFRDDRPRRDLDAVVGPADERHEHSSASAPVGVLNGNAGPRPIPLQEPIVARQRVCRAHACQLVRRTHLFCRA